MSDRKLVTIRTVSSVEPIPDADRIEKLRIDGWSVVSQKGNFKAGDQCLFMEIDSFIDTSDPRFAFLAPKAKEWRGKTGYRLRSIKLKNTLSQGLALPLSDFPEVVGLSPETDLAEKLGIVQWELEETSSGLGRAQAAGTFPNFIRKTHQERIQNIWNHAVAHIGDFEISEKLNGMSASYYLWNGEFGVCSHNLQVKEYQVSYFEKGKFLEISDIMGYPFIDGMVVDTTPKSNVFWEMAKKYKLDKADIDGYAIQGEIVGPGVRKNPLKLQELAFYVFDIFDIKTQSYLRSAERWAIVGRLNLPHVPVLDHRPFGFGDIDSALAYAEGKSYLNNKVDREGIVLKSLVNPNFSCKIISNKYLLNSGDK